MAKNEKNPNKTPLASGALRTAAKRRMFQARGDAAKVREDHLGLALPDKVDELETLAERAAEAVMAANTHCRYALQMKQEMRHAIDIATAAYLMACELEMLTRHDERDDCDVEVAS